MPPELPANLLSAIAKHWGFRTLRPLQTEAILAVLARRDSLVVMPTGGGKSLCYQSPAITRDGLTVVVSPLIALMKDQVDGLARNGINAPLSNPPIVIAKQGNEAILRYWATM